MYWLCLSKEELDLVIYALEQFYNEGVATDEEEVEWKKMQELVTKLELFKKVERP